MYARHHVHSFKDFRSMHVSHIFMPLHIWAMEAHDAAVGLRSVAHLVHVMLFLLRELLCLAQRGVVAHTRR